MTWACKLKKCGHPWGRVTLVMPLMTSFPSAQQVTAQRDSKAEDKLARATVVLLNPDIWCHGQEGAAPLQPLVRLHPQERAEVKRQATRQRSVPGCMTQPVLLR